MITLYSANPSVKTKRIAIGLAIAGSILLLFILIASHGIATPLIAAIGHLLIGAFGTAGSLTLSSLLLVGGLLANNSESANPGSVREFFRGLKVAAFNLFTFGIDNEGIRQKNTTYVVEIPKDGSARTEYHKDKKPSAWVKWLGIGLAIFAVVSMLALIIASHGVATPLLAAIGHGWIGAFGLKGSFVLSSLLLASGSLSASSESAYPGSIKKFFKGIGSSLANIFTLGLTSKELQFRNAGIKKTINDTGEITACKPIYFYKPGVSHKSGIDIEKQKAFHVIFNEETKEKEAVSSEAHQQRLF